MATLSTTALATLEEVKRDLSVSDASLDSALIDDINGISALIERVTGIYFKAREFRRRFNANWEQGLVIDGYRPQVHRVAYGGADAISIIYSGSAPVAVVSVENDYSSTTSGKIRLESRSTAGVTTISELEFSSYPSVSVLATAIGAISGWSAISLFNTSSYDLKHGPLGSAKGRMVFGSYPDREIARYTVDPETGVLKFVYDSTIPWRDEACQQHGRARYGRHFYGGPQSFLVEWHAGYSPIPADVNATARELARDKYFSRLNDPSITQTVMGPYSVTFDRRENAMTSTILGRLGHYMGAGAFVA